MKTNNNSWTLGVTNLLLELLSTISIYLALIGLEALLLFCLMPIVGLYVYPTLFAAFPIIALYVVIEQVRLRNTTILILWVITINQTICDGMWGSAFAIPLGVLLLSSLSVRLNRVKMLVALIFVLITVFFTYSIKLSTPSLIFPIKDHYIQLNEKVVTKSKNKPVFDNQEKVSHHQWHKFKVINVTQEVLRYGYRNHALKLEDSNGMKMDLSENSFYELRSSGLIKSQYRVRSWICTDLLFPFDEIKHLLSSTVTR